MKSMITPSESPILAMETLGAIDGMAGSHMVSKTPADAAITPYPICRQNYKVVYKKDANGYWNFVQCDAYEVN